MIPHIEDTIVALSSAPGGAGRAIVRLSGPGALACALKVFSACEPIEPDRRRFYDGTLQLPGISAKLPADLHLWPQPRTYTGQELVEIHTLGCPPVVDVLIAQLLNAGARSAQPGEFTLRAFLAGKLDFPRAEAVLGVVEASDRDELRRSLAQLAGGVTAPLQGLREDLLNLLADVEAALDFAEEDIRFVDQRDLLMRLTKGLAQLTLLQKQFDQRAVSNKDFRVVFAGRPNAGKSSLFNALTRDALALVSSAPGTTRDYLVCRLELDAVPLELVDTAGWQKPNGAIGAQAQMLGAQQFSQADLVLLCLDSTKPITEQESRLLSAKTSPPVVGVATKCDMQPARVGLLATSAVTGLGLQDLRALLAERVRAHRQPALSPSISRCRHHVDDCLSRLRSAHSIVLNEDPPELLALELRGALEALGEMVGAVYTDDLLDRIFSRFCIGK